MAAKLRRRTEFDDYWKHLRKKYGEPKQNEDGRLYFEGDEKWVYEVRPEGIYAIIPAGDFSKRDSARWWCEGVTLEDVLPGSSTAKSVPTGTDSKFSRSSASRRVKADKDEDNDDNESAD